MELTKIHEWTEPTFDWEGNPRHEDEWPYPTQFNKYVVSGDVATKVRRALGVEDESAPVIMTETITSGGYSEYTQENDYEFKFESAGESAEFAGYSSIISYSNNSEFERDGYGASQNFFDWLDGK